MGYKANFERNSIKEENMKRVIALMLVVFFTIVSLTGCYTPIYKRGELNLNLGLYQQVNAKVEADRFIFNKNDVTLDFFFCFYRLDDQTLEQAKKDGENIYYETILPEFEKILISHYRCTYAIYISNNKKLIFEMDENGALVDLEKGVNAQLLKFFDYEEAFSSNYGFTTSENLLLEMHYNHSEKLTIPENLLNTDNEYVYIHVVSLDYNVLDDRYYNSRVFHTHNIYTLDIEYKLLGDNKVILFGE